MSESDANAPKGLSADLEMSPPAQDPVLEHMVDLANKSVVEVPVVLSIKGNIIAGIITSGRVFFEETIKRMNIIVTEDEDGSIALRTKENMFSVYRDLYPGNEDSYNNSPKYIHIKNANIFVGLTMLPTKSDEGWLWRFRLCEVDGFSFPMRKTEES